MPQLDSTWFASQLFWLALTFVALYLLMARTLVPRIEEVLEARQARLTGDLDRAAALKSQAEEARSIYEKALAEARASAQRQVSDMEASVSRRIAQAQSEYDAAAMEQLQKAEAEIAAARARALVQLAPFSAELAGMIVEKIAHFKPSEQQVHHLVDSLSKERLA